MKIKSEASESYFSNNFFYNKNTDVMSLPEQRPNFEDSDSSNFMLQPWGNRFADIYDQSKPYPSGIIPASATNNQHSPYVPLCASCHLNPSSRLYPASMFWLPNSCPFPYPCQNSPGAIMEEEGSFDFGPGSSERGDELEVMGLSIEDMGSRKGSL